MKNRFEFLLWLQFWNYTIFQLSFPNICDTYPITDSVPSNCEFSMRLWATDVCGSFLCNAKMYKIIKMVQSLSYRVKLLKLDTINANMLKIRKYLVKTT